MTNELYIYIYILGIMLLRKTEQKIKVSLPAIFCEIQISLGPLYLLLSLC